MRHLRRLVGFRGPRYERLTPLTGVSNGKAVCRAEHSAMSAHAFALLFVALLAAAPGGASAMLSGAAVSDGAGGVPSIDALRERIVSARGTLPPRERVTVTYTSGGVTGKRVTLRDGNDDRIDVTYGPLMSSSGVYHKQAWRQNDNGETVLEQPDPGNATREVTTTTVTHVTAPLDAFVIATLNAAGDGSKEYVDPRSYRIVRFEQIRPTGTTVSAYDDFRTVAGYTRAWHWTVRDGHPENDTEYRVAGDDPSVAAPNLAIPDSRREFVEFPAGKTTVDLPVREDRGKFIVRVEAGTRGLDLLLDTGASGIVLDDDIVRGLGLVHYGSISNPANAGRYTTTSAIVPHMSVGDLQMHDVVVRSIPHLDAGGGDYKVVGLLGFDFIGALALTLDYEHGRVTATRPDAFAAPTGSTVYAIPVRLGTQRPLTDVTLDGALGERFLIDTGASGTMLIFDYFARRHPEALRSGSFVGNPLRFHGVGGTFDTKPYRVGAVRVGNVSFKDFTVYRVMSGQAYSGNEDGVIGTDLLQLFTLYTDYGNSMLYLVPNGAGRAARS